MDQRRVRFDSIEGLQRSDLELVGEIWLRDICAARWSTPGAMKLAAQLVRYMAAPDARRLTVNSLERQLLLTKDEIVTGLKLLRLYRAIADFVIEAEGVTAALHLSTLQKLQVLEVRQRLAILGNPHPGDGPPRQSRWMPTVETDPNSADAATASGRGPSDVRSVGY